MSSTLAEAVLDILKVNPAASNEAIALHLRSNISGCNTSPASVASIKSKLRKDGFQIPRAVAASASIPASASNSTPTDTSEFNAAIAQFTSSQNSAYGTAGLPESNPDETYEEAKERIALRYDAMERMTRRLVQGKIASLIISGPPGLGKSFTVQSALVEQFPEGPETVDEEGNSALRYDRVSGSISAVGLYQALWYTRNGGVLVLDDVDEVFRDETALNLLKGALDSSPVRVISWRKEARWLEEHGIPDRFEFKGHVVFLTNLDFEALIQSGKRDAEHFKALIDRSMYLCLTLRTRRDFMIRIRQVAGGAEGMLATTFKLTEEQVEEVLDYIAENQTRFYGLSLRLAGQVAQCMAADPENWRRDVEATKMRTL